MIVPMSKVWMFGPKGFLDEMLILLQGMGVLHVRTVPEYYEGDYLLTRRVLNEDEIRGKSLLEHLIEDIRGIQVSLPPPSRIFPGARPYRSPAVPMASLETYLTGLSEVVEGVGGQVRDMVVRRKELKDELETVRRYEKVLHALSPFIPHMKDTGNLEFLGLTISRREEHILPYIREAIGHLTENRFELFSAIADEETIACLIAFPRDRSVKVRGLLWEEGVTELHIPAEFADMPLGQAMARLIDREKIIPNDIARIEAALLSLSERWHDELLHYRRLSENLLNRIETSSYLYQTKMTFFLSGWVPKERFGELSQSVESRFGGKIVVHEMEITGPEMDEVPVALKNFPVFKPFELFLRILPLPRYGTIDPTIFIGIFFPIFFGMILGDIAYGLFVLAGGILLQKRYRHHDILRDVGSITILAAVYTIIFGFLYGEFLGNLGEHYGIHPILFDRMTAIIPMMVMALSVGALHIMLGLVLGAITHWGQKHKRKAFASMAKLGTIVAVIGFGAGVFMEEAAVGHGSVALFLVMLAVLLFTGGVLALLKLIELMGNILSYARIMAIGLSSVILAFIANKLGGMTGDVVLGVLVAALFHLLSLTLGVFSPTIHAIRLHYVEFFGKFFVPGGRKYLPFRTRKA